MQGKVLFVIGDIVAAIGELGVRPTKDKAIMDRIVEINKYANKKILISANANPLEKALVSPFKNHLDGAMGIEEHLENLGLEVLVVRDSTLVQLSTEDQEMGMQMILAGVELIVLSSSSALRLDQQSPVLKVDNELATQLGNLFGKRLLPLVVLAGHLLAPLNMAEDKMLIENKGEVQQVEIPF
jgi:hypothetical protein